MNGQYQQSRGYPQQPVRIPPQQQPGRMPPGSPQQQYPPQQYPPQQYPPQQYPPQRQPSIQQSPQQSPQFEQPLSKAKAFIYGMIGFITVMTFFFLGSLIVFYMKYVR